MNRFARYLAPATAAAAFVLMIAGASVTSTGSGLAVPDWPLSFGQALPPMQGGVFFEHGHRMIAGVVGLLTFALFVATIKSKTKTSLKWLAGLSLLAVIIQAVLGGLTVLYKLPAVISVAHAGLGQIFFCLIVALAFLSAPPKKSSFHGPEKPALKILTLTVFAAFMIQIFLGALVRHKGAGLAIPDFPLAFGRLVPKWDNNLVALQLLHRLGALTSTVLILNLLIYIVKNARQNFWLLFLCLSLTTLCFFQILFGALIIWSQRAPWITTAHVALGALMLAGATLATLIVFKPSTEDTGFAKLS